MSEPLILHLSDLHLCLAEQDEEIGDYKSDLVPKNDRLTRIESIKASLSRLSEILPEPLDSVVVSGDITLRGSSAGFAKLDEVFRCLGDKLPDPGRILIVPGNHDVKRGNVSGSQKYHDFIELADGKGYIRPFLEDTSDDMSDFSDGNLERHVLFDRDCRWAVVPVNSSHYCGAQESVPAELEGVFEKLESALELGEFNQLKRHFLEHDAARLTQRQLDVFEKLCCFARRKMSGNGVLMVCMHHQLLPVGEREEVKPYESLINLGKFRSMLRSNGVQVFLHGHKHEDFVYTDYIESFRLKNVQPNRILVVSSPYASFDHGTFARLIRGPKHSGSDMVSLFDLTKLDNEVQFKHLTDSERKYNVGLPARREEFDASRGIYVEGDSVDSVYHKLQAICDEEESTVDFSNVTCRVYNEDVVVGIPAGYPDAGNESERFQQLVKWWQKTAFRRLPKNKVSNHGLRLSDATYDHVEQMVKALVEGDSGTSKATSTLLMPGFIDASKTELASFFPSFCLIQYVERRRQGSGDTYLDVIGYFRKQELRYWWAVNVAELASLQASVLERLNQVRAPGVKKGTITTIAAIAHFRKERPSLLSPELNIRYEEDASNIWILVHALCNDGDISKESAVIGWRSLVEDLRPTQQWDKNDAVPLEGLAFLYEVVQWFSDAREGNRSKLSSISEALNRIVRGWKNYPKDRVEYDGWKSDLQREVDSLFEHVEQCLNE